MGLETGTYISDLVSTNPLGTDAKSQGDDHIRLLKSTIKASFPNVNGAVSATDEQLSAVASYTGKNKIINGNFDIWQRATSQTSSGYGSDDRWSNLNVGSTKTHSQQSFTVGQSDVPTDPFYYSRTVVTTSAGASNYVVKSQRIEYVRTLAGKSAVLTFYAKADSAKPISIELVQNFGTGGSPSSEVTAIGVNKITLSTSWVKYTVSISIPSISGKTLGTTVNTYLSVNFWFDAGSSFNSRTDTLGQQSGTFDIASVQLEEGTVATPFDIRPIGLEMHLCQRYYEEGSEKIYLSALGSSTISRTVAYRSLKRGSPSLSYSTGGVYNYTPTSTEQSDNYGFSVNLTTTNELGFLWTANAELS